MEKLNDLKNAFSQLANSSEHLEEARLAQVQKPRRSQNLAQVESMAEAEVIAATEVVAAAEANASAEVIANAQVIAQSELIAAAEVIATLETEVGVDASQQHGDPAEYA